MTITAVPEEVVRSVTLTVLQKQCSTPASSPIKERGSERDNMKTKYFVLLALLLAAVLPASAQTISSTLPNTVNLSLAESATLTLGSGSVALSNTAPTATVTLTYKWQVGGGHTSATIYAFFGTLSGSPTGDAAANFSTQIGAGAVTPCTGSNPVVSTFAPGVQGVCSVYTIPQNIATDMSDSQTVNLIVNLVNGNGLIVGTATETLNLLFQIV